MTLYFFPGPAAEKKAESGRQVRRILLFFRLRDRDRSASDFFVAAGILSGTPDRKNL